MKNSRNVTALLMSVYRSLLNLLYPARCPLCHQVLKDSYDLVCARCADRIRPVSGQRCFKCGKPVRENEEYCRDCTEHPRVYRQGRGIFLYDDQMKASVMRFKYSGCREYGRFYGKAMYYYGFSDLQRWKPDVLVPIPMYWKKQRMRGYNQAEVLARVLSGYSGIPTDSTLLKKKHSTKSQKKLDALQRKRNLKDAFSVTKSVIGMRILLVDDVYTTGSTIDAAAQALLEKGAAEIFFLTLCIGSNR